MTIPLCISKLEQVRTDPEIIVGKEENYIKVIIEKSFK